jgi:hypothetical protein
MDSDLRTALLACGLVFLAAFAYATVAVAADSGFDIFTVVSLLIIAMIGSGLIGAMRNPPK